MVLRKKSILLFFSGIIVTLAVVFFVNVFAGSFSGLLVDGIQGSTNMNGIGSSGSMSWNGPDGASGAGMDYAPSDEAASSDRKLVKTARVYGETQAYDDFRAWLDGAVSQVDGYFESTDEQKNEKGRHVDNIGLVSYIERDLSCIVRVPSDKLADFLSELDGQLNVLNMSTDMTDVTLDYVDTESHVAALRVEQDRLLELLAMAENLDDILAIEDRLSNVRYQIDSYESQLRTMDNRIDYSLVRLEVCEVTELTEVGAAPAGFFDKLSAAFFAGVERFKDGAADVCFWMAGHVPEIGLLLIFVFIARRVYKRARKQAREASLAAEAVLRHRNPSEGGVDSEAVSVENRTDEDV